MLSDEGDPIRMRDGVRWVVRLVCEPPVRAIAERFTDYENGEVPALDCQDELDEWLMAMVGDTQHPVGTCRMGSAGDPRTVVDSDCSVVGVSGLRVVDASVMPEIPGANTHLPCDMIGEHMAARLSA